MLSFDGLTANIAPSAQRSHWATSLGNLKNVAIAIGDGSTNGDGHLKVEHLQNEIWSVKEDFPFSNDYIIEYSLLTIDDGLFLFGKVFRKTIFPNCNKTISGGTSRYHVRAKTARYDGQTWTEFDSLLESRAGHRSILLGNEVYHIGGAKTYNNATT